MPLDEPGARLMGGERTCVCVCVCVCARARPGGRVRGGKRTISLSSVKLLPCVALWWHSHALAFVCLPRNVSSVLQMVTGPRSPRTQMLDTVRYSVGSLCD